MKVLNSAKASDGVARDLWTPVFCDLGSNSTDVLPSSAFVVRTAPYLSQFALPSAVTSDRSVRLIYTQTKLLEVKILCSS